MSDVLMIPVTTVQPDLVTQTDVVVYVPLASKNAPGIVKIGEGLNITNSGLLSLDFEKIDDKINQSAQILTTEISLVNEDLQAHKNNFNNPHRVTKAQVGLGNVENTSDINKPVSNAVRAELTQLDTKITNHINDFNNPHRVTKSQVGLSNVDNTSDLEKPVSTKVNSELISIKNDIKKVEAMIEGQSKALALDDYSEVVDIFNNAATNAYKVGQIILVNTTDVPDLWVFSVENTHVDYAYVGDYDIVEQLEEHGTIQFGYYKLAQMESKSVDLENYVNIDGMQTITGVKLFQEQLGIVNPENGDVNLLKHINNNFLLSANNGENIINIDEQLKKLYFYNKPVALEDDIVTLSGGTVDNFALNVSQAHGGLFVTNNNIQTGYLRNGNISLAKITDSDAQLTYYSSANLNESSIKVSDGLVELQVTGDNNSVVKLTNSNFTYNDSKILTEDVLTDTIGANYLSYTEKQNLTDEQKSIARDNIGVSEGGGTSGLSEDAVTYYENFYDASQANLLRFVFDKKDITNSGVIGVSSNRIDNSFSKTILTLISNAPSKVLYKEYGVLQKYDDSDVNYTAKFSNLKPNTKYSLAFTPYINWSDSVIFGKSVPYDDTSTYVVEFTTNNKGVYLIDQGLILRSSPDAFTPDVILQFDYLTLVEGDFVTHADPEGGAVVTYDLAQAKHEMTEQLDSYLSAISGNVLSATKQKYAKDNLGGATAVSVDGEIQYEWSADSKVDSKVVNDYGEGTLIVKPTGVSGRAPSLSFDTTDNERGTASAFGVDDSETTIINMNVSTHYSQLTVSNGIIAMTKTMDDASQTMIHMTPQTLSFNTVGDSKVTINDQEIATVTYVDSLIKTTLNTEV